MVIQALACSLCCLEAWMIDAVLKGLCDHVFGLKELKIIILAQCHSHSLLGSTAWLNLYDLITFVCLLSALIPYS